MNKRKIIFIISALIILLGGSFLLSKVFVSMKAEPTKRPDLNLKRYVKSEEVVYSTVNSPIKEKGRVISGNQVALVAEASGKLQRGSVDIFQGATFKKGQLLGLIYKDEVELALKARKSQFLADIVNILADMKVDFPDYYETYRSFFDKININEGLPELPEVDNERLKIYLANKNFLSEYYGILQDEKKLLRHYLYAPFNGTFSLVDFQVGSYVNSGSQIAKMIRTDHLEIEVPVKNSMSKWIHIGQKADVFIDDNDAVMQGKVVRKSDFIVESTQSRSIYVEVTDLQKDIILSGEYKVVQFAGQEIPDAMEIPRNAVFNSDEVFLIIDGKLKKKRINILKWNENTLVFNGLPEGSVVVSEPLVNVMENTAVSVLQRDGR